MSTKRDNPKDSDAFDSIGETFEETMEQVKQRIEEKQQEKTLRKLVYMKPQEWNSEFDKQELKEIRFCIIYEKLFNHGTDGHLLRTIIAKMASILNEIDWSNL